MSPLLLPWATQMRTSASRPVRPRLRRRGPGELKSGLKDALAAASEEQRLRQMSARGVALGLGHLGADLLRRHVLAGPPHLERAFLAGRLDLAAGFAFALAGAARFGLATSLRLAFGFSAAGTSTLGAADLGGGAGGA